MDLETGELNASSNNLVFKELHVRSVGVQASSEGWWRLKTRDQN
jgi:hypothetical protein